MPNMLLNPTLAIPGLTLIRNCHALGDAIILDGGQSPSFELDLDALTYPHGMLAGSNYAVALEVEGLSSGASVRCQEVGGGATSYVYEDGMHELSLTPLSNGTKLRCTASTGASGTLRLTSLSEVVE